jgi:archaellum component FlaG (FlaF/FlaG flagellin family)
MNIKKSLFVFILFFICLTACTNKSIKNIDHQSLQKSSHTELPSSVNEENVNVEMKVEHPIYEVNTDKLTLQIKNKGESLSFGTRYDIELFKDGSWFEIPLKDDIDFTMMDIKLGTGKTYKNTISLKTLKYDLIPGHYRVRKSFYTGGKEITISSPFELK